MALMRFLALLSASLILVTIPVCVDATVTVQSAILTPGSSVSAIAEVNLVPNNGDNEIVSNPDGFFCNSGRLAVYRGAFCVEVIVYNTGCPGIETLTVEMAAQREGGDTDIASVLSVTNSGGEQEYITFLNNWDGADDVVGIPDSNLFGGVLTGPNCGDNALLVTTAADLANDFFNGIIDSRQYRSRLVQEDVSQADLLTDVRLALGASPITYTIVNDPNGDTLETSFEADRLNATAECFYQTTFDTASGNDYVIAIGTDAGRIIVESVTVTITCEVQETAEPTGVPTPPTSSPTGFPSAVPTGLPTPPTLEPTFVPTVDPTDLPSGTPTDSPSPVPTAEPTDRPTLLPTSNPVKIFLEPCDTDPCECNEEGVDPFCSICHRPNGPGCSQCQGGFWKLDYNYPCVSCEETFEGCKFCQDFNGCGQCEQDYVRRFDQDLGAYCCVDCRELYGEGCKVCQQQGCGQCNPGFQLITNDEGVRVCV